MVEALEKNIINVSQLLQLANLTIPEYQRPYKWTARNINQLFQDLDVHQEQSAYRLGTVVFHQDSQQSDNDSSNKCKADTGSLNIVDGQQRTLTLFLAVHAIIEQRLDMLERQDLAEQLKVPLCQDCCHPLKSFIN